MLDYHPLPTQQNPADPENFILKIHLKSSKITPQHQLQVINVLFPPFLVVLVALLVDLVYERANYTVLQRASV